jgi:hypothetical protein
MFSTATRRAELESTNVSCRHTGKEHQALSTAFGQWSKLYLQPLLSGKTGFSPIRDCLEATGLGRREWRLGHLR